MDIMLQYAINSGQLKIGIRAAEMKQMNSWNNYRYTRHRVNDYRWSRLTRGLVSIRNSCFFRVWQTISKRCRCICRETYSNVTLLCSEHRYGTDTFIDNSFKEHRTIIYDICYVFSIRTLEGPGPRTIDLTDPPPVYGGPRYGWWWWWRGE